MRNRAANSNADPIDGSDEKIHGGGGGGVRGRRDSVRSALSWTTFFALMISGSWVVYHYQYENLPVPLIAEEAGERGFSEQLAREHLEALTRLGLRPVGTDALDRAVQYVWEVAEKIKDTAHLEVDVQVDKFHAKPGANRIDSGMFKGKTLAYTDLTQVVLRILLKYLSEAAENSILVSSHIDTVFSSEGAGDCGSCISVMLELARGISQWAHGLKHGVIFLFNTGEEGGLTGSHSFMMQHSWSSTIRVAVDLEAMGIGGKSSIFQGGLDPWAVENFAKVAKYPSAQVTSQGIFLSGVTGSGTDFQVYKEVGGLSGLDFAYADITVVYHTKNDKLKFVKSGSLQHLGENMPAFLLQAAASSQFPGNETASSEVSSKDKAIFFDILGKYMVVYRQGFANMLYNAVIFQTVLLLVTSLVIGGYPAAVSLGLSCLTVLLMWMFSLGLSVLVAYLLPFICSPVSYIASPWLVVGLFAAPALLGAMIGQHIGYIILSKYLWQISFKREDQQIPDANLIKLETERWLFKAGLIQWLALLILGSYYEVGSTYIAFIWLVSPAFARTMIGLIVRIDKNPGATSESMRNLMVSAFIAVIVCHGAMGSVVLGCFVLFGLTLSAVLTGAVPPFHDDLARAVNVVHVVETQGKNSENQDPTSYISLFSGTPGTLSKEAALIEEGFVCGNDKVIDFVNFVVKYGCWSTDDTEAGWSASDIPNLHVKSDVTKDDRITQVMVDVKVSSRWSLAINMQKIKDFILEGNADVLVPTGKKNEVNGWQIIQFEGGKDSPTKFDLTLFLGEKHYGFKWRAR